ncbi:hypothetical protein [Dyadobacter sp. OTU695]|uniref:hypothetical protein n=1 Tax=Dyadobacter sp. OTU695 TaxID=3043860 RepID=UPI00313A86F5
MKQSVIENFFGPNEPAAPMAELSWGALAARLSVISNGADPVQASRYRALAVYLKDQAVPGANLSIDQAKYYPKLLEKLFPLMSATSPAGQPVAWGLCPPLTPTLLYGTGFLFELLADVSGQGHLELYGAAANLMRQIAYSLILQRLYDFKIPATAEYFCRAKTGSTCRYLQIEVNTDFIEVSCVNQQLPELDFAGLYSQIQSGQFFAVLQKLLPLHEFMFSGVMGIQFRDAAVAVANARLKDISIDVKSRSLRDFSEVIEILHSVAADTSVDFDLLPFFKVNNRLVHSQSIAGSGIMHRIWEQSAGVSGQIQELAQAYASAPEFVFCPDLGQPAGQQQPDLELFRHNGVGGIALLPIYYHGEPVGMLCIHSGRGRKLDQGVLVLVAPVLEALGQLLYSIVQALSAELDRSVKERFTFIQPAVEWKFNEVAWQEMSAQLLEHAAMRKNQIVFNGLFPLYGAIDVRDSSIHRRSAVQEDLREYLGFVDDLLDELQRVPALANSPSLRQLRHKCRNWLKVSPADHQGTDIEFTIKEFLHSEVDQYLHYLCGQDTVAKGLVGPYMDRMQQKDQAFSRNSAELDDSMQRINDLIIWQLEADIAELQFQFPFYFEKFRTDGCEYDIYIGQAIAPERRFSEFHLRDLRLWQLHSMIKIGRLAGELAAELPKPLQTTQLIFVHNQPVDISFREDEKRFDVEGAYNIRYQMIKKRIDKIHILGTQHRLTQPGKVAIIYSHERDIKDYLPFIDYLKDDGQLLGETEHLLLEELQGVSGLRAVRLAFSKE